MKTEGQVRAGRGPGSEWSRWTPPLRRRFGLAAPRRLRAPSPPTVPEGTARKGSPRALGALNCPQTPFCRPHPDQGTSLRSGPEDGGGGAWSPPLLPRVTAPPDGRGWGRRRATPPPLRGARPPRRRPLGIRRGTCENERPQRGGGLLPSCSRGASVFLGTTLLIDSGFKCL